MYRVALKGPAAYAGGPVSADLPDGEECVTDLLVASRSLCQHIFRTP